MSKEEKVIDDKLYSRQLYVLGHEAMKRMAESNVLIVGLNGVGLEIAKNVILQGVKSVTLNDDKQFTSMDFSSHFYAENHIGKNRVEVSIEKLKDLNGYCPVHASNDKITKEFLVNGGFKVVVFTDQHISNLVEVNQLCREIGIKFIAVESRGLAGAIFVDCGKKFEILDTDGETPPTSIVANISNSNPGVVSVDEDHRHGLYTDDKVVFEGIEGMDELNNLKPMPIVSTGLYTFTICDTTNFSKYKRGGYVTQVKEKKTVDYASLEEALKAPKLLLTDFGKETVPNELHFAFQALSQYTSVKKRFPRPYNKEDAEDLIKLAIQISGDEKLKTDRIRLFSYTCQGNLSPMAALLGGFAAQEVQKACSGKFSPLDNFLYFESYECLPTELPEEKDCQPINSRYDGQIVVFGKKFQEKLSKQKFFVVGAGALGCEYLKNFAMMGMGCEGKLLVTDMDNIETSNLNRQFLFRTKHIGQLKSKVAGEVAKTMNKELNVISLQDKVAPETENLFDDNFWEDLDFVVNALDNVQARLYVDSRCVYFRKPLFESGTLGTKGNTQTVIPFITESYGSSRDPPEKEIPICTLKNFPNQIEHTIQYSRDLFEGMFKQGISDASNYLTDSKQFFKQLEEQGVSKNTIIKSVYENLVTSRPKSFEECVIWARLKFDELYYNQIVQMLFNFPEDMLTTQGTPFWGGSKRPPKPIEFDLRDPTHMSFIISASNLRAYNFGIKGATTTNDFDFAKVLKSLQIPKFEPKSGVKIATTKEEAESMFPDDEKDFKEISQMLPKPGDLKLILYPSEFEKDDDTNFHIDFITAASNLRAINYKIPIADRHKTKGIAGKIIPAMVTTTALITGLASFEIYKVVQGINKLESFKNSFINIGLPFMTQSDPIQPAKQKYLDKEWSLWDRFDVDLGKDVLMKEFMEYFKKNHGLEITMMSCGTAVIYNFFLSGEKLQRRMEMKLSTVVEEITGKKISEKQKYLNFEICCNDLNGDDADVPYVRYRFK